MDLIVMITGAGAPGIKGTLYSLHENFDGRKIKTIGVDIREHVVGKYLCDKFYRIPPPSSQDFIPTLLSICEKEKVDVVLPQVTAELFELSKHKKDFENIGTRIAISNHDAIIRSNNKYELMKVSKKLGLPTPEFFLVNNFKDLEKYAMKLGYPENPVVVKPPVSNGMRGLRIINENINYKEQFYKEKPTGIITRMDDLYRVIGDTFPELIVMEYLPGDEYSVDVLKTKDDIIIVPRLRMEIRSGITFSGIIVKHKEIIKHVEILTEELGLEYAFGYQFKNDTEGIPRIIECNPRIQGTMVMSTLAGANIIYGAVKYSLGEDIPQFKIKWGTKFLRYWGGIGILKEKRMIKII